MTADEARKLAHTPATMVSPVKADAQEEQYIQYRANVIDKILQAARKQQHSVWIALERDKPNGRLCTDLNYLGYELNHVHGDDRLLIQW